MSDQFLSYAALRRWFSPLRSVTRDNCESAAGRSILTDMELPCHGRKMLKKPAEARRKCERASPPASTSGSDDSGVVNRQ